MLHAKLAAGVLVGVLATTAVGAGIQQRTLRDTPLGQAILGNLGRLMTLRAELNLTDEQKTKIGEVLKSHRTEIATQAKNVWEKRQALQAAVLAEQTDEAAIREAADQLGKAAGDAAVFAARLRKEVAPLLTDEQRAKIQKTRGEMSDATEAFLTKAAQGTVE